MIKAWISAFRLKTLPLSLASIFMGSFLAKFHHQFSWSIMGLAVLTTIFLQILSNLANDYGDFMRGADNDQRVGPQRALQSGSISVQSMRNAVISFSTLSLMSGIGLLYVSFSANQLYVALALLGIGLLSIWAAINYTAGKNPYGYRAMGDMFVFIFFGLIGVGGSYFVQTNQLEYQILLPAASCGLFATGVLNINNIRDIESDKNVGKITIPVLLGRQKAKLYHWTLLITAFSCSYVWLYLNALRVPNYFFILLWIPAIIKLGLNVWKNKEPSLLNSSLRDLSLFSLFFVLSIGLLLFI